MARKKKTKGLLKELGARYNKEGFLLFSGKIEIKTYGGEYLICGLGKCADNDTGATVIFKTDCSSDTGIYLSIIHYTKMDERLEKVFTAILRYYAPARGIPIRLDMDLRDLEGIKVNGKNLPLELLPVVVIDKKRPWHNAL